MDTGQRIVGDWLHYVRECEFVQYDVVIPGVQGDIDVVGIDTSERVLYVCEVTTHLVTGIRYTKKGKEDNQTRFMAKFAKDIAYANEAFPDFHKQFMLWSPYVRSSPTPDNDQLLQLSTIQAAIDAKFGVEIQLVINEDYWACLRELRSVARSRSDALSSPIMRLFQIEEHLSRRFPDAI